MAKSPPRSKQVSALVHEDATRKNIPTAELQSTAEYLEERQPQPPVHYPRARPLAEGERRERDEDLDPQIIWNGARICLTPAQIEQLAATGSVEIGDAQLVWRGKDTQDWSDLIVQAPPLYIQEKIHPKVIIDDLKRRTEQERGDKGQPDTIDLFADFNGIDAEAKTEFYQHDQHWSNRMILGDSLQVMASLAERERLAGKVQCIYFDPPYGIKFNSNWQVSTQNRDVKDGKQTDISREPEQVKAFRDTWKDGIHSYLTYLRDRLTVMRELLHETGSVFVQIGNENPHRVRAVMDEVFGAENFVEEICFRKKNMTLGGRFIEGIYDYILFYARDIDKLKFRRLFQRTDISGDSHWNRFLDAQGTPLTLNRAQIDGTSALPEKARIYQLAALYPAGVNASGLYPFSHNGQTYSPPLGRSWKSPKTGLDRLAKADRLEPYADGRTLRYRLLFDDYPISPLHNVWANTAPPADRTYVVQTADKVVQRCILMATDPGDLVLDPTCGSGTTAFVAEQWGRRWITLDTSRVALALARTRLMSARYPYYLMADSPEGRRKEQEVSGVAQPMSNTQGDIRQGFVYERAPHVTLKSIANNAEIDVIWEQWQAKLEPLREALNRQTGRDYQEWEIPREVQVGWDDSAIGLHRDWWNARIARQNEIDASIAKRADVELLYDRPYEDKTKVRVAGPFTVESLSPHRVVPSDADELWDEVEADAGRRKRRLGSEPPTDFADMVLENLRTSGVQQATRGERIEFTALGPWPGRWIGAEGRFMEGDRERRAAIFIGPEFGTVQRADITAAAREATDARFDILICTAFNFDAHTSDITSLGPLPILKAKMNPDLHMAGELKNTGKGNLFIVFGEPDIDIEHLADGQIQVRVKGVDVFDPNTGDVRSDNTKGIAAWFIDTDYNEESFFVRHAYFLGANDPYKSLKSALRAEIEELAWSTLYRDVSRPFDRPTTGRIAVKVINHFGDEVMKVFGV